MWSHAGRHFRLTNGGVWWATLPKKIMRQVKRGCGSAHASPCVPCAHLTHSPDPSWCIYMQCFDSPDSLAAERVNFEGEDGDRRQELVFIGTKFNEEAIRSALDECLVYASPAVPQHSACVPPHLRIQGRHRGDTLVDGGWRGASAQCTDDEMVEYRARWADETAVIARETGPLRFKIGDRVTCNTGPGRWARGFVAALYYREYDWPSERWAPYRIELDDDTFIWAPSDVRGCIRTVEEDPADDEQIRCRACRRRVSF